MTRPTRILLVEDDPEDELLTRELLAAIDARPYELEWAKTYEEGLAAFRADNFDVALVDHQLGAKTGLDLLQERAVVASGTPVIMLTGMGRDVDLAATEAGAVDYLHKGDLTALELERSIRYAVETRRRHRAERRLQAIVENAYVLVAVLSDEGSTRYASPALRSLIGGHPGEVDFLATVHPDERDGVRDTLVTLAAEAPGRVSCGFRIRDAADRWRWLDAVAEGFVGDPALEGVVITARDVTDWVTSEVALTERVKELRCLYGFSKLLLERRPWVDTLRLAVDLLPVAFQRPDRIVAELVVEDQRAATGSFDGVAQTLTSVIRVEDQVVGELRVGHQPDPNADAADLFLAEEREMVDAIAGRLGEALKQRRDATSLDRSEAFFRSLAEGAGIVIGVVDPEGVIQYASAVVATLVSAEPEGLVGVSALSLCATPDDERRARQLIERAVAAPGSLQADRVAVEDAVGAVHIAEVTVRSLLDDVAIGGLVVTARDVTAKVRNEEQLLFQAALLDQVGQVIFALDTNNCVTYWNRAAERTFGYASSDVLGEPLLDKIVPADHVELAMSIREAATMGTVWEGEMHLRDRAGERLVVQGNVVPLASGGRICAGVDITELRRTQSQLLAHRALIESVVGSAPIVLFALDDQGCFTFCEGQALAALGLTSVDVVGTSLFETYADRPEALLCARKALQGERCRDQAEFRGRTLETFWSPAAHGEGAIGVSVDVTDLVAAREEQGRLLALIEASPEFVGMANVDAELNYVNPAGRELVGIGLADEVRGRFIHELHPEWAWTKLRDEAIPAAIEGGSWRGETALIARDGREIPIWAVIVAHRDASGAVTFLSMVASDLTERKELEAELRQAQKMEAIGRLAGGVAHDFNNLLTVIQGHVELLLDELGGLPGARDDLIDVGGATRRAAALTRQLLAFSRQQVLEPKVVDMTAQVRAIEGMVRRLVPESIELVFDLPDRPCCVRADPTQIDQVLLNLVVNAQDALGGAGKLTIGVGRDAKSDASRFAAGRATTAPPISTPQVVLTVSDTGSGMPPEVVDHIFEPFFTTKEAGKGTGLGLATVYGIVRQSGGQILVDSREGAGTSFRILLPEIDAESGVESKDEHRVQESNAKETVLLVEDDPSVRRITKRFLRRAGYDVLDAGDGKEALGLAREHPGEIHVVFSDVVMPEMGGPELVARVRELHPDIAVVMTSGYVADRVDADFERLGAVFVGKPFNLDQVTGAIRRALRRS